MLNLIEKIDDTIHEQMNIPKDIKCKQFMLITKLEGIINR